MGGEHLFLSFHSADDPQRLSAPRPHSKHRQPWFRDERTWAHGCRLNRCVVGIICIITSLIRSCAASNGFLNLLYVFCSDLSSLAIICTYGDYLDILNLTASDRTHWTPWTYWTRRSCQAQDTPATFQLCWILPFQPNFPTRWNTGWRSSIQPQIQLVWFTSFHLIFRTSWNGYILSS